MRSSVKFAFSRAALLGTAATAALLFPGSAFAQVGVDRPKIHESELTPQIVISNPGTPTTARDPVNVNGVGQMIIDQQNGFLGLCTATLINPRTVIFAAHCVNENAPTDYGNAAGGLPIGFGFSNNNLPGIRNWYLEGPNQGKTDAANYFYNANQVTYHPGSLEPAANSFLYSDVALASLDTPTKNIPTWALLFSSLPATPVTADGTGYHVTITGYGNNGTATTGSTGGIDYRRRIAENTLGALASIDDFEGFIFGAAPGLPQNLYWIDFDDPKRGTAGASPYDFNAWRDNALPNEGITASGDSGGPLILDRAYAKQLVIGVLSGGYTRFFNNQPANGYGTASFYQPLYLYWDWIAANNPYRYVAAVAGDGKWSDPKHWVTTLDPSYQIIGPDGKLLNGVPTTPGEGVNGSSGKFGETCFQSDGVSQCYNVGTDTVSIENKPIGTAGNGAATVSAGSLSIGGTANAAGTPDQAAGQAVPQGAAPSLPAPTLANGLPGATGFVPNNVDGDHVTGTMGKYFDVTLAAAGTTTLDTQATIDRLGIAGTQARLDIARAGALNVLGDVNLVTGTLNVDGTLTTPGDFFMLGGGLTGTGTITAPYFTSVMGTIAPGTVGTVGTLNFRGNVVLASGTLYVVDVTGAGSDRIAVAATNFAAGKPVDGIANLGGQLGINYSPTTLRAGNSYTIVTAEGGVTGSFAAPAALSAILKPTLSYSANAVQLRIDAGRYADVVDPASSVQRAYAALLDQNRTRQGQFDGLYGPLDLLNASSIRATLTGLAPAAETTIRSIGTVAIDTMANFHRERLIGYDLTTAGGSFARIGQPLMVASNTIGAARLGGEIRTDSPAMTVETGKLPDTMSAFVAGGYLNGDARPMAGTGAGRDNFDGWYIAAGLETVQDAGMIGFSLGYTRLDGDAAFPGQRATGDLFEGTLYTKGTLGAFNFDTQLSAGVFQARTQRAVSVAGTAYRLKSRDNALALNGEVGISRPFDLGKLRAEPRASLRASHLDFSPTPETGGPAALRYDRTDLNSVQSRLGASLSAKLPRIRPFVSTNWVHDFTDRPTLIGANLVGGVGPDALFSLNSQDHDWGEVNGGITVRTGAVDLSLSVQTDVWRKDLNSQSYRGSLAFRF